MMARCMADLVRWMGNEVSLAIQAVYGYFLADLKTDQVARAKRVGVVTIIVLIGSFIGWGVLAPLEGAVIADGHVVVDTNKKTVQHLEGGIIRDILVKDGHLVEEGQDLVVLQDDQAQSRYELLRWRLLAEKAKRSRLIAEQRNVGAITFDDQLIEHQSDPEVRHMMEAQTTMFEVRNASIRQNVSILQQRVIQLEKQIEGLKAQKDSAIERLGLLDEELQTAETLLKQGLEQRPRILGIKRKHSELKGRLGEYDASIAKALETISETNIQMVSIETDYQQDVSDLLSESETVIASIQEELIGARDIYERTVIKASRAGVVTNLKYHTIGGVVAPGAPIMDIVPQNDELVVEAKLKPIDIDSVYKGQHAKVQLTAYQARFVPKLEGVVSDISPDLLIDEATRMPYYSVRVRITEDELNKLSKDIKMYPGMPTQAFIVTDSATFAEYLVYPLVSSMQRAFRESSAL